MEGVNVIKKLKKLNMALCVVLGLFAMSANANESEVTPLTKEEVQQGIANMKQSLHTRIEAWGATLGPNDFEKSFFSGRQLNKQKRQEVCAIFQSVVDDTYKLAVENRARLKVSDQPIVSDRNTFIEHLGYPNNIVDTQMGFNCRLR